MVLMGQLGEQQYRMQVNNLISNIQDHEPLRILPIFHQNWTLVQHGEEGEKWPT
jgi:hypothetical protein